MKLKAAGIWIACLFVAVLLFSALSQPLLHQSWGFKNIQGPSMEPTFKGGDVIFAVPYISWLIENPRVGDIIVFDAWTDEGIRQTMIHRIHEIKDEEIFTKGDNVPKTDQDTGWKALNVEEIQGFVPEIFGHPMVIPNLGVLINEYWLYLVIGISDLLIILYINDLRKPRKSKRERKLEERRKRWSFYGRHKRGITYSAMFLVFTIFLMFLFSSGWQSGYVFYDVSDAGEVFGSRGSNFGVLQVGTKKSIPLSFSNEFWVPIVTVFAYDDPNLAISENPIVINYNQTREVGLTAFATKENIGHNAVQMSIVRYPEILPSGIIAELTKANIPMTLFLVSCLPVGMITLICYGVDRKVSRM